MTKEWYELDDLRKKIFLDRYALKDLKRETLRVGDTVIFRPDRLKAASEIGFIIGIKSDGEIAVETEDGATGYTVYYDQVDKPLELDPREMIKRVAQGISKAESTEELQKEWQEKFEWLLEGWKFVPGGRILTAAGTNQKLSNFNCFVLPSPHDSRQGIFNTLSNMAEIMSRGGGVGINTSTLRPRNAYVKGVNGRSSGAVSWGALYSFVTGLIEQAGSRRGALILIINDWHPDVEEFINSKTEMGKITNANISVNISDKFMEAVRDDANWELKFPDTEFEKYDSEWDGNLSKWEAKGYPVRIYKVVEARHIWNQILECAWRSAEPGLWFGERSNKLSNSWYYNELVSTNPCGEIPLSPWGVCNLGAINLAQFYDAENEDVDWKNLDKAVRIAVRFLDNVIDQNFYFLTDNEKVQRDERKIGLGIMGLAELLIKMGIRYGSPQAELCVENIFKFMTIAAYYMSADLGKEKGSFPRFDSEKYLQGEFIKKLPEHVRERIKNNGMRNVTLITVAPTGSTSTMVGTSSGIEPFFSWNYFRKSRIGLHEQTVDFVYEYMKDHNIQATEDLPEHFVTAMQLTPEEHVAIQAAAQKWVDNSISKTVNAPNGYSVKDVGVLYEQLYNSGCKGGTIYRDGSRDEQVLTTKTKDDKVGSSLAKSSSLTQTEFNSNLTAQTYQIDNRKTKILNGKTIIQNSPFGNIFLTLNFDEDYPFEVFITVGKAGTDIEADAQALGRLISLTLRSAPIHTRWQVLEHICYQLKHIGGSSHNGFGPNKTHSMPDAVAHALSKIVDQWRGELQDVSKSLVGMATRLNVSNEVMSSNSVSYSFHDTENIVTVKGADLCPECGNVSLLKEEGCSHCVSCGYSAC